MNMHVKNDLELCYAVKISDALNDSRKIPRFIRAGTLLYIIVMKSVDIFQRSDCIFDHSLLFQRSDLYQGWGL